MFWARFGPDCVLNTVQYSVGTNKTLLLKNGSVKTISSPTANLTRCKSFLLLKNFKEFGISAKQEAVVSRGWIKHKLTYNNLLMLIKIYNINMPFSE